MLKINQVVTIKRRRQRGRTISRLSNTGDRPQLRTFRWVKADLSSFTSRDASVIYRNTDEIRVCLKVSKYEKEVEEMENMTRQEFVASLRR